MAENNGDLGSFLAGFLIGGLIGAATALLMAPQSGEETRAMIREKSIELRDQAMETADEARHRAEATAAEARARADYYAQQVRQMTGREKPGDQGASETPAGEMPKA
jgi:gas vesicle protein